MKELQNIENSYPYLREKYSSEKEVSPTEKIGGGISGKFAKVMHRVPMLSLSNTYNISEVKDFNERAKKIVGVDKKIEYILELK